MVAYLIRRLVLLLPTMVIPAVIVFILVLLSPGDPASLMLGPDATIEQITALRQQMGLDQPAIIQLGKWFANLLQGNLGDSIFMGVPVSEVIIDHLEVTLLLTGLAMVIAGTLGMVSGVLSAVYRGTWLDQIVMVIAMFGVSIPEFWLALNLIFLFAVTLQWFPVAGYVPLSAGISASLQSLFLPALALGVTQAAFVARMVRSTMLEVIHQDYIRTARAKGLAEKTVVLKHMLKNAMIPTVTVLGLTLAILIGGAITVETVFNLPGIGRLMINAVLRRDYPVIQGIVLFIAFANVIINLVVDLIYLKIDPRIKY